MKKLYLTLSFIVVSFVYTSAQIVDPTFILPQFSGTSEISAILRLPGDKLLIAGEFVSIGITPKAGKLVRLNADGTIDISFNTAKGFSSGTRVYAMAAQADGKIVIGGILEDYNGNAVQDIIRLNADGSLDASFNPGTGLSVTNTLSPLINSISIQTDGKILASGFFHGFNGVARTYVVRLNTDGSVDNTYNPVLSLAGGATFARVESWLQPDGKALLTGNIGSVNGTTTSSVVRLNTDGTLDTSFNTGLGTGFNSTVHHMGFQSDGKIIATGNFTTVNGASFNKLARLNADGSVDATFPADVGFNSGNSPSTFLVLADNSILIAGNFQSPKSRIMKLSANGVVDNSFNVGSGITSSLVSEFPDVTSIAVQSDGKAILAGTFSYYNNQRYISLVRVNSNGSLDTGYKPDPAGTVTIHGILPTADGKVYVAGTFISMNGVDTPIGLVRLNANGTRDTDFNVSGIDATYNYGTAKTMVLDNNGKLLVGGEFRIYSSPTMYYGFARFNTDGSIDKTWTGYTGLVTAATIDGVYEIKPQADGKIIIGGRFSKVNGQDKQHFVRLNADGTLDNTFNASNAYADVATLNFKVRDTDGKMILAQYPVSGSSAPRVSLVNADGTRDNAFNVNSKFNNFNIYKAIFTSSGKILVGGDFTQFDGQAANRLVRLNDTGVRDATFVSSDALTQFAVKELVQLPSGNILVGKSANITAGSIPATASYLDVLDENGNPLSVNLLVNGEVVKIATTTSHIYVGGRFTSVGTTSVSSLVRLTNPTVGPVGIPREPKVTTDIGPRRNILTWVDDSSNEAGFEIQRSSPTNTNFVKIGVVTANTTTFTDATDLTAATRYFYRVKAVNIGGSTGYSIEVDVSTLPDPPAAPSGLVVVPGAINTMAISWTDNSSNEDGFELYRKEANGTTFTKVITTSANSTNVVDPGLQPEVVYVYKVRAINSGGASAYSPEVSNLILGVSEYSRKSIVVYPNPVSTELVLENPTQEIAGVECFSAVGGKVLTGEKISPNSSLSLKVSGWSAGVYFVTVRFFDRTETHKVLKF